MPTTGSTIRSGVSVQFGLLNITVSVTGALVTETGNRTVCCAGHDPVRISQRLYCPSCDDNVEARTLGRAREVGEHLVVLPDFGTGAEEFAKTMALTPHPAPQVETGTISGDKVYYLVPAKGHEKAYAVLAAFIETHPELAFCTRWAPRSRTGMFRIGVRHDKNSPAVLTLHERRPAALMRAVPELSAEPDLALVAMLDKALASNRRTLVSAFDASAYLDDTEERIQAYLSSVEAPAAQPVEPLLAALEAMTKRPRRARKPKPAVQPVDAVETAEQPSGDPVVAA